MNFRHIVRIAILALIFSLQACVAPTATSERYRVLSVPVMESVKAGMSQAEVLQILGQPWNTVVYPLKPNETYYNWKWRNFLDEGMIFGVVFDADNRVLRAESWRDMTDRKNISAPSWGG
jgi:outer membrane protein assembly factor BamE (lipoprotein component of BamABCDE complex)